MCRKLLCSIFLLVASALTVRAQDTTAFTFAAGGAASIVTAGGGSSTVTGYARIQNSASSGPSGFAVFGFRQNNILVTETAVPSAPPIRGGRIYAEVSGPVNTGLAIANPNNQSVTVTFYYTDLNGVSSTPQTTDIPANGQIAKFLNQAPFNVTGSLRGTFTFNASLPVSAVALRGLTNSRSEFLITTLPVADLSVSTSAPIIFPHYADGAGWSTQILLVNPSDFVLSGSIRFHGDVAVAALPDSLNVPREFRVYDYNLPPRSSRRLVTGGIGSTTTSNWIQVTPSGGSLSPTGVAIFSYQASGITVSEAGVPAVSAGAAFRLYAESSGDFSGGQRGSVQTGVAIANTSATVNTVSFELTTLDGLSTGLTGSVVIQPNSHTATFLSQIRGFETLRPPFQGVLRVSAPNQVSVIGLRARINERQEMLVTTITPVREDGTAPAGEMIFPHLADSGGYTSQFVLMGNSRSQSGAGSIRFIAPTGLPLNLSTGDTKTLKATGITDANGVVTLQVGRGTLKARFFDEATTRPVAGLSTAVIMDPAKGAGLMLMIDPSDRLPMRFFVLKHQGAASVALAATSEGGTARRLDPNEPVPIPVNEIWNSPITEFTVGQIDGVGDYKGSFDESLAYGGLLLRELNNAGLPVGKYAGKLGDVQNQEFTGEQILAQSLEEARSGVRTKLFLFAASAAISGVAPAAVAGLISGVALDMVSYGLNASTIWSCSASNGRVVVSTVRVGGLEVLKLLECNLPGIDLSEFLPPLSVDIVDPRGIGPCSGSLELVRAGNLGLAYAAPVESGRKTVNVPSGAYKANVRCPGYVPKTIDVSLPREGADLSVSLDPPPDPAPSPTPAPATVASVRLTPASLTGFLDPGTTVQFTATPLDANGNIVSGVTCTFEIFNPVGGTLPVASINPVTGLMTVGTVQGAARVEAVCGGVRSAPSLVSGRGSTPAPPPAPTPTPTPGVTDGVYVGSYTGSGTLNDIPNSRSGPLHLTVRSSSITVASSAGGGTLASGTVASSGAVTFRGIGLDNAVWPGGDCRFSGTMNSSTASGTWSCTHFLGDAQGTWSATRR